MTINVKLHVNGRHRATVTRTLPGGSPEVTVVEGNYQGSANPGGEHNFGAPDGTRFHIAEEAVPETPPAPAGDAEGEQKQGDVGAAT